ncbi:MAG TPA: fumarylacetoacetate hydrolase family protein [Sphingomicrobium sp.]|nr:fumarylacetoacetate hydrolase family protein [Sphingomicrobium sp.]
MKLAKVLRNGEAVWAVVAVTGAVDVSELVGTGHGAIHSFLNPEGLRQLGDFAAARAPDIAPRDIRFAPFLTDPEKIICVGVNYHDRNAEYRDGSEAPKFPSLFMRAPTSFTGHDSPLVRPKESEQLDYEGEIAIIVGKPGRRIPGDRALEHIAGLTLVNEGTVRDWVRHAKFNVTQGKNFDSSGAIGPWMVSADEIENYDDLAIQTRVNGELRQDDTTAHMIFGFAQLIEYISAFTTLKAGDIISTGTPTGAGARFDPPRFLKPGDSVEVSSPMIGTLHNGIVDG